MSEKIVLVEHPNWVIVGIRRTGEVHRTARYPNQALNANDGEDKPIERSAGDASAAKTVPVNGR